MRLNFPTVVAQAKWPIKTGHTDWDDRSLSEAQGIILLEGDLMKRGAACPPSPVVVATLFPGWWECTDILIQDRKCYPLSAGMACPRQL